jgi:hypothetical protein
MDVIVVVVVVVDVVKVVIIVVVVVVDDKAKVFNCNEQIITNNKRYWVSD